MAGFLRIAPELQHGETMNSHPNHELEAQWWETSLKTHRRWLLLLLLFFPWIFEWRVSTANFFPWPSLKEHWNSLQWEKLDLFDHVTNISFIQKHDLSVSTWFTFHLAHWSLQFSLALVTECCLLTLVSTLAHLKKHNFLLLFFLAAYFLFSFYFWMAH